MSVALNASTRVGWCPGALRPMQAGDGLILRVKPRGGVLTLERAEALGRLAIRFGNGLLDLTARANLQIRGVSDETLAALTDALSEIGLLDPTPEAEAVRNVVASPLAGLDKTTLLDVRPVVTALEDRLIRDRALHALPAKWSIVVDDGGCTSLSGMSADVRFEAASDGTLRIGLAADPARAACAPAKASDILAALGRLATVREPKRMRDLVREMGAAALFARAGLRVMDDAPPSQSETRAADMVGVLCDGAHLGVAAPFGSLTAPDLLTLAEVGRLGGAHDLRLTPWRVLILTGLDSRDARVAEEFRATALILDRLDPRLTIAACSGAPACSRATTPVRSDATAIAARSHLSSPTEDALLVSPPLCGDPPQRSRRPSAIAVHVSGCAKGCAHDRAAQWTLVGCQGRYDVVKNGKAGDIPDARALSFQEAASWISRKPSEGRQ